MVSGALGVHLPSKTLASGSGLGVFQKTHRFRALEKVDNGVRDEIRRRRHTTGDRDRQRKYSLFVGQAVVVCKEAGHVLTLSGPLAHQQLAQEPRTPSAG